MSNAWGRDMEAIDSPSAVRQRARVGPAAGGGTHLSRTRSGRCRREKTRKRVERTTTPRRLWVCRPTTPRCPCGCFPRLLWSGKRGLQLPAVLTATSLAPPTAPRGLHASPVRFPGALAREQVRRVISGCFPALRPEFIPKMDVFQVFCPCGSMIEFVVGVGREGDADAKGRGSKGAGLIPRIGPHRWAIPFGLLRAPPQTWVCSQAEGHSVGAGGVSCARI